MNEQTIIKRLAIALVAVIVLGVIVWFFFIRDSGRQSTGMIGEDRPDGTAQTETDSGNEQQQEGTSGQPAANGSANQPSPSGTARDTNPQLANVGPGNTIGVFLMASVIGAVAHHVRRARNIPHQ